MRIGLFLSTSKGVMGIGLFLSTSVEGCDEIISVC